jgi:hypothetical protein
MTAHELAEISTKAVEAMKAGNNAEMSALLKKVPITPAVAAAYKKIAGADWLKAQGFDLSLAEERYGRNWLER